MIQNNIQRLVLTAPRCYSKHRLQSHALIFSKNILHSIDVIPHQSFCFSMMTKPHYSGSSLDDYHGLFMRYLSHNIIRRSSDDAKSKNDENGDQGKSEDNQGVIYEGSFASLTLKLKRVSLTTAFMGLFGVPLIALLKNGGDVPAVGKAAVGGVAVIAATGSTLALSFCFSPYVHTLEVIPSSGKGDDLLKATNRNILGLTVETIFDPKIDVQPYEGNRPFCNFLVQGKPLFVHPELIHDQKLYLQLFGKTKEQQEESRNKQAQSQDDEIF